MCRIRQLISVNTSHRCFDCTKLHSPQTSKNDREDVESHLTNLLEPASTETSLRSAVPNATEKTVVFPRKKTQNWFNENDENITRLWI